MTTTTDSPNPTLATELAELDLHTVIHVAWRRGQDWRDPILVRHLVTWNGIPADELPHLIERFTVVATPETPVAEPDPRITAVLELMATNCEGEGDDRVEFLIDQDDLRVALGLMPTDPTAGAR